MNSRTDASSSCLDATDEFMKDVVAGLGQTPKVLPCKYFYDERGCELFDAICELDEYYVTRVELEIMRQHAAEMAAAIGPDAMIFEYGSGSSIKTPLLLDELKEAAAYVPVDIAGEHLECTVESLSLRYPNLHVAPVAADFTQPFQAPEIEASRRVVYFPGTTIGNFEAKKAEQLLCNISQLCGKGGGMLIGFDLVKETEVLHAAYNDRDGVTAEFNRNLLTRANRELGADFSVEDFTHRANYNEALGRIEAFLVSDREQEVTVGGKSFAFQAGEAICTEHSHKYRIEQFDAMAALANMKRTAIWTDANDWFAVAYYEINGDA